MKQRLSYYFWLILYCAIAFCCPGVLAQSSITQATQISAVYNSNTGYQSVYFADSNGHLNERQISSGYSIQKFDLTQINNLPTITSPTVSAVYYPTTGANLIFYLSGTSTANVVMVTETGISGHATVSFPSANNFLVGGSPQPANRWQSVWAAVDGNLDVDFGVQIINGQDDPDQYGPRGYVFVGGVEGNFTGKNENIYKGIGRDPEHLQQQVQLFYDPSWEDGVFIVAFDPEGEGHIHTVAYNSSNGYYYSEDLMNTTDSVAMQDTASGSGGNYAVCTPSGFAYATNGSDAELYYYGTDGYLHEITSTSADSWGSLDINKSATNSPLVGQGCGPISAIYNPSLAETAVAYTSPNGATPSGYQLNVITGAGLGKWTYRTQITTSGTPILGSPMSSTRDFTLGTTATFYIGKNSQGEWLYKLIGGTSYSIHNLGD